MRRRTALATAAVAGGAGLALLAGPVFAATSPTTRTRTTCIGSVQSTAGQMRAGQMGAGQMGAGQMGPGQRFGRGLGTGDHAPGGQGQAGGQLQRDPGANLPASGTLTAAQRTSLAAMAEEEKLAHDVYTTLATSSGDSRFTRIAAAEQRHLVAVRVLLSRYSVTDPTTGTAVGQFRTGTVQSSYDTLVAQGSRSLDAALTVGRTIENTDIADLRTATNGVTAADVTTVYQRLLNGSQHHLAAFGG